MTATKTPAPGKITHCEFATVYDRDLWAAVLDAETAGHLTLGGSLGSYLGGGSHDPARPVKLLHGVTAAGQSDWLARLTAHVARVRRHRIATVDATPLAYLCTSGIVDRAPTPAQVAADRAAQHAHYAACHAALDRIEALAVPGSVREVRLAPNPDGRHYLVPTGDE